MIRKLTTGEIAEVYQNFLKTDFPPEECRPLSRILELMGQDDYLALGMFDDEGHLIAYAFFGKSSSGKTLMMDYFAVVNNYRQNGHGSRFFQALKEQFSEYMGIVYEVEDPARAESEDERFLRERRIGFYLRNGGCMTHVYSKVCGVNFQMMYIPIHGKWDDLFVAEELEDAYRVMVLPDKYHMIIDEIGINKIHGCICRMQ